MTHEELKKRAEDLGNKVKAKYDELMKSHWDNMAKAFGVPDGESVNMALSRDLEFIGYGCERGDAVARELVRLVGVGGDHDPAHYNCVCRLSSKMCGCSEEYLYVRCFHPGNQLHGDLVDDMPFINRRKAFQKEEPPKYGENLPFVRRDFSDIDDEFRLSQAFKEAVAKLKALKADLETRDAFYPNMHKAVASVRGRMAEGSRKSLDRDEKALDNL